MGLSKADNKKNVTVPVVLLFLPLMLLAKVWTPAFFKHPRIAICILSNCVKEE